MQQFSRRRALALIGAGFVVVACGGDDDTVADDPPGGSSAGTAPDGSAVGAPPLEDYDLEATYRYMYPLGPSRFDPQRSTSSVDFISMFLVYDRLLMRDEAGNAAPGLATEWEFVEDGAAFVLTLRDGVTFHDGEPFDAEAVRANIERGLTVEGSSVAAELDVISSVEVVDPLTVRLNLSGPGAALPLILSDRAGMMLSPAAFDKPDLDLAPVGAGMFRVTEYRPDDRIVMQKHEGYWDPQAPRCAGFEFLINADPQTRLNAIRTDVTDGTFVDPPQVADAERAGLEILPVSSLSFYHLQLNRSFEAFANLDVRKALNHAVDRRAIVDALLLGLGTASSQPFPEGYLAFDEATGTDTYGYDPDLARELLTGAGFDTLSFECILPGLPNIVELTEVVQAQLGEVGVEMAIRQVAPGQAADIFFANQEGQACVAGWTGRADPSQTLSQLFSDQGFFNPGRHTTPAVAEAIAATLVVQPEEERAAALKAASAAVVADALDVVLYFPAVPQLYTQETLGGREWFSGNQFRTIGIAAQ